MGLSSRDLDPFPVLAGLGDVAHHFARRTFLVLVLAIARPVAFFHAPDAGIPGLWGAVISSYFLPLNNLFLWSIRKEMYPKL